MSETVQAVKDLDVVAMIPKLLAKHHSQQFADIWALGVNTALRISDLLSIKFTDIQDSRLVIVESKTGKTADIHLNNTALKTIERIQNEYPDDVYLFQSRTSRNTKNKPPKPLTRQAVSQAFTHIGEIVGVNLGTHSMRKTRGYHLYKQHGNIEHVMKMLRHSSAAVTLRYIGIEQEDIDRGFAELEL